MHKRIGWTLALTITVTIVVVAGWGTSTVRMSFFDQSQQQWTLSRGRSSEITQRSDPFTPLGSPLRPSHGGMTVITQGYGVGTHAPAETWGAVDLAVDSDGDGIADPDATQGTPVIATHSGRVIATPMTWPGGNHVWVVNERYRTGYAHLDRFAVADGAWVEAGDVIGYVGSTGYSTGPHLDYQVWVWRGRWVNVSPLDYGVLQ